MAIGSVIDLIDYEKRTIEIAKKYGGSGTGDLSFIADNYNPNRVTAYPTNDMVIYNGKLYRANTSIQPGAGNFDSRMWDEIPAYDSAQTYNTGAYVVYNDQPYRCDENNVTGEWDSSKWTEASVDFPAYDTTASYTAYGYSKCSYESKFYKTNAAYRNSGIVGEFKPLCWTETTVEEVINNVKPVLVYIGDLSSLNTDTKGFITVTHPEALKNKACVGMKVVSSPYGTITKNTYELMIGSVDGGANGPIKIRVYDENMDLVVSTSQGVGINGSIQLVFI